MLLLLDDDQHKLVSDQIRRLERESWRMIDEMNEAKNDQLDAEESIGAKYSQIAADIEAVSQDDIDYIFQSM